MNLLSPAQALGFVALALGVTAFLQRDDRRLKLLISAECAIYVLHFWALGAPSAATSAGVSGARTLASVWYRSAWLAAATIALNVALALWLGAHGIGWIPVLGSTLGAVAVFLLAGLPMRLTLLASTCCWLANNLLAHSVGGVVLEGFIAAANLTTIVRMIAARGAGAEVASES